MVKPIKRIDVHFYPDNEHLIENLEAYASIKQTTITKAVKELLELAIIANSNGIQLENGKLIKKEILEV